MAAKLFISYSHIDEPLIEKLHKHLAQLRREGSISDWYDRQIDAGGRLDDAISQELNIADIFLACASPDWIASHYAYEREFERALEREGLGEAVIVPVILRPCDWKATSLQKFVALPRDGKAVTEYINQDVAFLEVVTGIRTLTKPKASQGPAEFKSQNYQALVTEDINPSARYRAKRQFDKIDKMDFINSAFGEIYRFFEASAAEIGQVPNIECRLSPLRDDYFSCTVINRGIGRGVETLHVRKGGSFSAIDILFGEKNATNTSNGGFSVTPDDYQLFLSSLMFFGHGEKAKMNPVDAAKLLWDDLLAKVGIDYA